MSEEAKTVRKRISPLKSAVCDGNFLFFFIIFLTFLVVARYWQNYSSFFFTLSAAPLGLATFFFGDRYTSSQGLDRITQKSTSAIRRLITIQRATENIGLRAKTHMIRTSSDDLALNEIQNLTNLLRREITDAVADWADLDLEGVKNAEMKEKERNELTIALELLENKLDQISRQADDLKGQNKNKDQQILQLQLDKTLLKNELNSNTFLNAFSERATPKVSTKAVDTDIDRLKKALIEQIMLRDKKKKVNSL